MKILVANIGSSSLKCQLIDMPSEKVLMRVRVERVGEKMSPVAWTGRDGQAGTGEVPLRDHPAAIQFVLDKLQDRQVGVLTSTSELDAVGFKPVCANAVTGCRYMDEDVLQAMMNDYFGTVLPLHTRAYVNAVRDFRKLLPGTPLVGQFETTFFQHMPDYAAVIPMPWEWAQKYTIFRQVGHGASHRYVNERVAALMGVTPQKINTVQCHLGGSSTVAGVKAGVGFDNFPPPPSGRSTETCDFLVAFLVGRGEGTVEQVAETLATQGGLSGISGMGFDFRDLQEAARNGHERARLAIESYVYHCRRYLGGYFTVLGHIDAITMAGGTGEHSPYIRKRVLEGLEELGILLDEEKNETANGTETRISRDDSRIQVWVIPTNEEIIISREVYKLLSQPGARQASRPWLPEWLKSAA